MVVDSFIVQQRSLFHLFFAVCLAAVRTACAAEATPATTSAHANVEQVVAVLESCPAWSEANSSTSEILSRLKSLSSRDTPILRIGIEQFVAKCRGERRYDISNMSKLFVLNRLLFAVPSREKFGGPFFGGWEGVPHDENGVNRMWPLSLGKEGELQLTGKYAGYTGDRYLAVQEFDHFLAKYGRRQIQPTSFRKP